MNQMMKMVEAFPDWMEGKGIFDVLSALNVPWANDDIELELDMLYFGNHSGQKYVAPIIRNIKEGDTLTDSERYKLAQLILTIYKTSWEREYELLQLEFNPIENYNSEEEMTNDNTKFIHGKTSTKTPNLTEITTPNLTETTTPNITETNTPNTTKTTNDSTYGFNSSESVPKDNSVTSDSGTDTTTTTGSSTVLNTGTSTLSKTGTESLSNTGTDEKQHGYKKTKKGFIGRAYGINTPQQMIMQSITLWEWSFYRDVVFRDIDRVLTLPIY